MIKLPLIAGLAFALIGCAQVVDRQGSYADLYPVEYAMGFDLNNVAQKQAEKQLDQFIDQYWTLIVNHPVALSSSSSKGETLAQAAKRNLLKRGAEPENVKLEQQNDVDAYDFEISILKYNVAVEDCPYHSINNYDQGSDGCYVERLRWTSMTRPERMLTDNNQSVENK